MSDREVVGTLCDDHGDPVRVLVAGGYVYIDAISAANFIILDKQQQEEFAQLYVAACHQAKVNAGQRPRVPHGPRCGCTPCLAEPSYAGRRAAMPGQEVPGAH